MRARTGLVIAVTAAAFPASAPAATIVVTPGHSIQAAVRQANPGDTVRVKPGTYHEQGRPCPTEPSKTCAVVVRKDGIRLLGAPTHGHPVVLDNPGGQFQGIAIARTADPKCLGAKPKLRIQGAVVEGFRVTGFDHDGVFLYCVDDWRVTSVHAKDNAEYGIFPSHVGPGEVDHTFAEGSNDTGIYVGQSRDVQVHDNTATLNVSGFEIENSRRVHLNDNLAYGNTAGILSFTLPGLDVKVNRRNVIDNNTVRLNNKANTCADPEDTVCNVPPGSGILLVGADLNIVDSNVVRRNRTIGIGVASYCIIAGGSSTHCTNDIDPNPDDNQLQHNQVHLNGRHPAHPYEAFASDLAWDTTGSGNCWGVNSFDTSFPAALPPCPIP